MSWRENKLWSDQFMPEVKRILGEHLIGEAPLEEDQERNTDLIVMKMAAVRIGVRVRRPGFVESFGDEFTIRAEVRSGFKTELAKIIEGWGDYFFYGHAGENGSLAAWALCDLKVFRLWFNIYIVKHQGQMPGKLMSNKDGSSDFRAYSFGDLPQSFIVARTFACIPS